MTHTKHNLTPAPETIAELFLHLERYAQKIGEGNQAIAYRFKPMEGLEGLENFVVRVPKSSLLKRDLKASSYLIPASQIVSKINIGNRLMELNYPIDHSYLKTNKNGAPINSDEYTIEDPNERISISLFQEGKNLGKEQELLAETLIQDSKCQMHPEPEAFAHVRASIDAATTIHRLVDKAGYNPYVRMFKKAYALGFTGLQSDIFLRNILCSEEKSTLRMVDQESRFLKKTITTEKEAQETLFKIGYEHFMVDFDRTKALRACGTPLPPDLQKPYDEARAYIKSLLKDAYEKTLMTGPERDDPDGSGLPTIPRKIEFAKVDSSHAVALEQPPKALLFQLQRIVKTADITR